MILALLHTQNQTALMVSPLLQLKNLSAQKTTKYISSMKMWTTQRMRIPRTFITKWLTKKPLFHGPLLTLFLVMLPFYCRCLLSYLNLLLDWKKKLIIKTIIPLSTNYFLQFPFLTFLSWFWNFMYVCSKNRSEKAKLFDCRDNWILTILDGKISFNLAFEEALCIKFRKKYLGQIWLLNKYANPTI